MDRLIYTAVSGLSASMIRQRMVASNMANAQTPGFRAEVMESNPVTVTGPQIDVRAYNRSEVKGALMKEGSMVATGRPLDIAMQGDTMLTVQAPNGGEGYTRRGDLSVSPTGVLQNGEGLAVMGDNGPVTVPLGSNVTISQQGAVMVADPTNPDQPATQVAQIKLANYAGSKIEKDLTGLFRVPGGGVLPADENAKIAVGTLEQSNVSTTEVLVEMIEQQRLFDIRTKLLATARDLDEGGANLMRMS
jgi:flagellar basal-body rod protein FlgF